MGLGDGKIVITGGSGFIMSHVAERLAETGREVVLFDNNEQHSLDEETKTLLARKRICASSRGTSGIKPRSRNSSRALKSFTTSRPLMGTSSRFKEWEIPTVEVNVLGTIHVLQASLRAGVKYFVHPPRRP